jgi:glycosyltransferase involved in cell wall biosynthesis
MTGERIAFDARYISDRYHGIGRYAFRLLEALTGVAPELTFVVFRGRGRDSRFDWESLASRRNIEIHAGPWPLYWPHEQLLWPRLLRRTRVDLFHTPYFVAPLLSSLPVINTVHDLIFERYPDYMPMRWSRPYYRLLMQSAVRVAQRVVVVSQSSANDLTSFYRVGRDKARVIPEGAEDCFRPIDDPATLRRLRAQYDLARPFVLAVGTRRPHKNFGRLVQAYGLLANNVDYDLVFVGPADERFPDDAQQLAQSFALNGRVKFLEWVPEVDLPGLYTLAEVAVIPSLIEGFGLPALEAMACATPVVAADTSSLPEVLGEAGLLIDPLDVTQLSEAVGQLMRNPQRRRELGEAGRARAEGFSWHDTASQVLELYAEVLF